MFMINLRNGEIYVIKLKTFGSFTVGNDLTSVQEGAWRSEKLEKLFVYLAINKKQRCLYRRHFRGYMAG